MKFIAERKDLLDAAQFASAPIKRSHLLVMDTLRMVAGDEMTLTGSDMSTYAVAKVRCAIAAPGEASPFAGDVIRWLQAIPSGALVQGEVIGDFLHLSAGRASVKLPSLHYEMYPRPATIETQEVVGGVAAIAECLPFASRDESRPHMMGVHFDGKSAVATTGVIMGVVDAAADLAATIPVAACEMILRAAGKADARLFIGERGWRAEMEAGTLTGQVIEMAYPPFRRSIGNPKPICTVDADALITAIGEATLGLANEVEIDSDGETATVSGERFPDRHATEGKSAVQCDGDPWFVLLNRKFLMTALEPFAGRVVSVSGQDMAFTLKAEGAPLVMIYALRSPKQASVAA